MLNLTSLSFRMVAAWVLGSLFLQLFRMDAIGAQQEPSLSIQKPTGYLILETRHAGLAVTIDKKFMGYTPQNSIALAAGVHSVVVEHPDKTEWLSEDWIREVNIIPDDTLRVPVLFKVTYSINSDPFGAALFFNNVFVGKTPFYLKLMEQETRSIKLSKPGYRDTTLTLGKNDQTFFRVALQPAEKAVQFSKESLSLDYRKKAKSKVLLYSMVGLTLVSGAFSLYFKGKGNHRFDLYRGTGNPALMERYYNDAQKFDRISAVSFGVFQVSFVASFYLFLKQANN
ncbi:MAG: PEGA domain-containing protein [bacterium]